MGLSYSSGVALSIGLLALVGAVRSYRAFRKREDAFDEKLCEHHSRKYSPRQSFFALCAIDKRLELDLCKDLRTLLFQYYLDGAPFAPACPDARLLLREEVKVELENVVRDALLVAQGTDGGCMTLMALVPVDGSYYALVQRKWQKKKRRRKSQAYIFGYWHTESSQTSNGVSSVLRFPLNNNVAGPWLSVYMSTQVISSLHNLRKTRGLGFWDK